MDGLTANVLTVGVVTPFRSHPANAVERGWETGTFFMYDPKVFTGGSGPDEFPLWAIILLAVGGFVAVALVAGLLIRWGRNAPAAAAAGAKPTRPDHHVL